MPDKEKIAYFEIAGMGTVRVNVRNVCIWHKENSMVKPGIPDLQYVVIQMNNGQTIKTLDDIEVVDEKLS